MKGSGSNSIPHYQGQRKQEEMWVSVCLCGVPAHARGFQPAHNLAECPLWSLGSSFQCEDTPQNCVSQFMVVNDEAKFWEDRKSGEVNLYLALLFPMRDLLI